MTTSPIDFQARAARLKPDGHKPEDSPFAALSAAMANRKAREDARAPDQIASLVHVLIEKMSPQDRLALGRAIQAEAMRDCQTAAHAAPVDSAGGMA